jgi:hypothetical protein
MLLTEKRVVVGDTVYITGYPSAELRDKFAKSATLFPDEAFTLVSPEDYLLNNRN